MTRTLISLKILTETHLKLTHTVRILYLFSLVDILEVSMYILKNTVLSKLVKSSNALPFVIRLTTMHHKK